MLLFQDIAVIPMLAVLPLLGAARAAPALLLAEARRSRLAVIVVTLGGGHLLARPVFRHIARTRLREIFTAFALLLVLVIALAFEHAGLSMALGAFLAGVLLAESEYRHEIEAAIEPFKGLLLGLFFIAVGMSVDFGVLIARPLVGVRPDRRPVPDQGRGALADRAPRRLPARRAAALHPAARAGRRVRLRAARPRRRRSGGIGADTAQAITLAVALSMLLTPFLLALHDRSRAALLRRAAAGARAPTCRRRAR